jgi:hypothetical protein
MINKKQKQMKKTINKSTKFLETICFVLPEFQINHTKKDCTKQSNNLNFSIKQLVEWFPITSEPISVQKKFFSKIFN